MARPRPRHVAWLPRRARGQRGFTLIEMLVVISIMGVLGAVVAVSMLAVVSSAQARVSAGELMNVQSAMNVMMMDQQLSPADVCASTRGATHDMAHFPVDPFDPKDLTRMPPPGRPAPLYPHYLRGRTVGHSYVCTTGGYVRAT